MKRSALDYLKNWKADKRRKPLVIRGARQVGKSHLVRMFAREEFEDLVEINFENEPAVASYFEMTDPNETLMLLEAHFNQNIKIGKVLLFLDEIQAAPQVFAGLRYFYEKLPRLHIIAAGSLLEFVLEKHEFSMPVGRIEYLHLGPMTFNEFLAAANEDKLLNYLNSFKLDRQMPDGIHRRLTRLFKMYLVVGGMPESMSTFLENRNLQSVDKIKAKIINTYSDDFSKYGRRVDHQQISTVFRSIPLIVGQKVKYVNISRDYRANELAKVLHMLELAGVCHLIYHSSCSSLPLGACADKKKFKLIFLDVGLLLSACGLHMTDIETAAELMMVNSGSVSEQFVGQHLLYRRQPYLNPELYYWVREKASSNAEVDFVITVGPRIIPVEVKAGKPGILRSLHQFVIKHGSEAAVRMNLDRPSLVRAEGRLPDRRHYSYPLLSLPLYMVEQVQRLTRELFQIQRT